MAIPISYLRTLKQMATSFDLLIMCSIQLSSGLAKISIP